MYSDEILQKLLDYEKKDEEEFKKLNVYNPWIAWLRSKYNKVHNQKWNFLCCVTGLPRVGKSLFAETMCYLLNKNFDMERDTVYKPREFSSRIKEIRKYGETIIWDEAGVGIPVRQWYDIQNREIGKMLQTVGHLRPIIFFVTPDLSFIDNQPKKLFHYFFEIEKRVAQYVKVKPFKIVIDQRMKKIKYQYPRYSHNGIVKIRSINFYKPPDKFIEQYEKFSDPIKAELREKSRTLMEKPASNWDLPTIQRHIKENRDIFMVDGKYSWKAIYLFFKDQLSSDRGKADIRAQAIADALNEQLKKEIQ